MGATTKERTGARRLLTAFGETKTVAEWAMDGRARAWAEAILGRLDEGMTPEQAIGLPVLENEHGPVRILAFGERKTLRDWADDFRAQASLGNIRERLNAGWAPETAISTPPKPQVRYDIEAFGERKSATAWAADPRAGAERHTIIRRIADGMDAEEAITTPCNIMLGGLTAFGETKSMKAWAEDPRCTVTASRLSNRVKAGTPVEEAITTPNRFAARLAEARNEERPEGLGRIPSFARLVTAFGETKSMNAWTRDPRCAVEGLALRARLLGGMTPEEAILTAPTKGVALKVTAFGETKTLREWEADPRCKVVEDTIYGRLRNGMNPEEAIATPLPRFHATEEHEAFGETKSLKEWVRDPRCALTYSGLASSVVQKGMSVEEALTTGSGVLRHGKFGRGVEAFGETKRLGEWLLDSRCAVGRGVLSSRLRAGWGLEEAMTAGERTAYHCETKGSFVEAFGERKNLTHWAEDARCRVTRWNLAQRLAAGWDVERAITTPSSAHDKNSGENHWRKAPRTYLAFGETKRLPEWAADPRAAVPLGCLRQRLAKGMGMEEALTTPLDEVKARGGLRVRSAPQVSLVS